MTDDEIIALNAELAYLKDAARTMPLLRLGKAHAERHWRVGPGRPESLADLQESIRAFSEAYGYLPEGDAYRGQAAFMNGFLRGTRATVYPGAGPADDANASIELLEEGLGYPNVHPTMAAMGLFMVGQLSLHRVVRGFQSPDLLSSVMRGGGGGMTSAARADADRAAESFREVIAISTVPEMTQAAQTMLTMAEVVQTLVSGFGGAGIGGFDMSRMLDAVTKLQQFQQTGFRMQMPAAALAAPTSIFDFGTKLAESHPLDRPTVVMSGAQPEQAHPPVSQPPLTLDVDAVRQDLRKLLSTSDDTDVYASAVSLLRADQPPDFLDELVALASSAVYGADNDADADADAANAAHTDAAAAADHFLLAAVLLLRARRDGDGDVLEPGDAEDAAASLVAAAWKLPPDDPDRIPALLYLATLLPDGIPPELTEQLASHLTDIAAAARALDADALLFPDPAGALRVNTSTGHIESSAASSSASSDSGTVIVIGSDALTRSDEQAVSAYPTLARLIERSRRSQPRQVTQQPVFLANPRGDRTATAADVMLLRRSFYARSRGLGQLIEDADGAGTADEVRGVLDCSLLHLACGVTPTGALELADGTELDLATLSAPATGRTASSGSAGVAILPPGYLHPLADGLLALGFDDVIGWRRSVPEPIATLMLFLLHAELVDHGRSPAAAVARVRRWPHDPERETWTQLPTGYAERLEQSVPQNWTALVHLSA